jgi:hypothetical protein
MRLKSDLYAKEQDDTIDKIIQIIGITTENNTITLYEIDNNEIIKQQLIELIPEIRTWFSFGHINPISNPDSYKRPYLTIIKQITKKKWAIHYQDFRIYQEDGAIIRTQQYTFTKRT